MKLSSKTYKPLFNFWAGLSVALFFCLLIFLISFYITHQELLFLGLIIEGGLLLLILILYVMQMEKLKIANQEREKTLQLLQSRLAAMEASADGIAIVNSDGELTYMNAAMMQLHAISMEDLAEYVGKNWLEIYQQGDQEKFKNTVMPILDQHDSWRGIFTITRHDNTNFMAEIALTKTLDGGLIGTVRDITAHEKAIEEKQELEQQFYQAQKMEAIGRLAGGIAHDFNNILAAMNGYAEFLIEDLPDRPKQQKFAENILQAGLQARELVDQMMSFSRHKQSLSETIDLAETAQEALKMLKASVPKTIELDFDIDKNTMLIDADRNKVMQALMNLCVNACDAMSDDRGTLSVHLKQVSGSDFALSANIKETLPDPQIVPPMRIEETDAGKARMLIGTVSKDAQYACLEITDTGHGISAALMEKIFEPFFTTKVVGKGTGLGLSTTHGMMVEHRGALILQSEIGKGTSFELYFPLSAHSLQEEILPEKSDAAACGQGLILLVEDQEQVRDMMQNFLERMGYEAEYCNDGLEALKIIKENPNAFDLVISDHNMPGMTGLELVEQCALVEPDLPFLIITGYSEQRLKDIGINSDAIKAVLHKPVSHEILAEHVATILAGKTN